MFRALYSKLKESLVSVLPVAAIVYILALTPAVSFSLREMAVFTLCVAGSVAGIALFNLGADISMTPMGTHIGGGLKRTRRLNILLPVAFALGVLVTIAEPDLSVLAGQVSSIMNGTVLIVSVGIGVGLLLLIGVLKIIFKKNLTSLLFYFYLMLFCLCAFAADSGKNILIPLSFDSGGVTTGPVTVPFIMALGVGIAGAVGGDRTGENSFGLVSLCSVGPIIAVMALALASDGSMNYTIPDYAMASSIAGAAEIMLETAADVLKALSLIVVFFFVINRFALHVGAREIKRILFGILYTFIGLVVFLTCVSVGFMPVGFRIGSAAAEIGPAFTVILGTVTGAVTVLAEPAVHVLKRQVERVTGGTVSGKTMMIALSAGVGVSIGLSCLRIVFDLSILWYVIPGYLISLGLSFFVPGMYTAIAFDSGGVASGPLTSGFILPMIIGICSSLHGESGILGLAFGVVAMVAMTPPITIQVLGFRAVTSAKMRRKITLRRILDADDEQIIYFSVKGEDNG